MFANLQQLIIAVNLPSFANSSWKNNSVIIIKLLFIAWLIKYLHNQILLDIQMFKTFIVHIHLVSVYK